MSFYKKLFYVVLLYISHVKNHLQKAFANDFRMKFFNYELHITIIITYHTIVTFNKYRIRYFIVILLF